MLPSAAGANWSQPDIDSHSPVSSSLFPVTPPQTAGAHSPTLSETLWMYVGPAIFFIGIVGNALVLIASSLRPMTGTSTSVYLRFMAAADLLTLVFGIVPDWLVSRHGIRIKELHPVTCKSEKFAFYTSSCAGVAEAVGVSGPRTRTGGDAMPTAAEAAGLASSDAVGHRPLFSMPSWQWSLQ
jgi:hypothetical protein